MLEDKRNEVERIVAEKINALQWIKLVGVGDVASGKTCLIKYFCENKFTAGYQATVGVDYGFKIETVGDKEVRVHLWDLAGSDMYYDTRIELYSGTDGVFITYDVTNPASFDGIDQWYDECVKICSSKPLMVLCACKTDLKQKRIVSREKGEEWASRHRMGYFEVSSATGDNVTKMFAAMLATIANKM